MTPKDLVKLYRFLCEQCRYQWVYEGRTPDCAKCDNKRFSPEVNLYRTYTARTEHYEDFEHETLNLKVNVGRNFKGRAVVIYGKDEPYPKELFDHYLYRVDIIFGTFLTKTRFIGTSIPRYDIFHTSIWIITA